MGVDLGCLKFIGASRIIVVAGGILGVVGGACGTADPDDGAGGERGSGGIGEFTLDSPAVHGLGDVAQGQPLGVRTADLKAGEVIGRVPGRDGIGCIGADDTPDKAVRIIGAGHELGGSAGLHRFTGGVFGDHRGLVGSGLFRLDGKRSRLSLADRDVQREAVAIEQLRQPVPVKIQRTILLCQHPIFIDIQMCAERRFNLNVEVESSIRFLHIDLFNQHPQVRFRHDTLRENVVNHADIPFELRLPIPQDSGDVLQFFDLLFCRSDFFLALLNHAVVAFSVRPISYPLH